MLRDRRRAAADANISCPGLVLLADHTARMTRGPGEAVLRKPWFTSNV